MKRLFLSILVGILMSTPCLAKDIKFVQVTDVHFQSQNPEPLKQLVDELNNQYTDADFIVFTGDNIDKANPIDMYRFLKIIKPLKTRVYVIPGNHDLSKTQGLTKENYMKLVKKVLGLYHPKKPNFVFKKGKYVFITMNGVREFIPSPNGYYRENELEWLDKNLTKYQNKKVIILQHFPLLDSRSKVHRLYKKEEYLEVLNKHNNVIAIVSGHYHENREEMIDGVYNIISPKFLGHNNFKIIEIEEKNDFVFTTLIEKSENN